MNKSEFIAKIAEKAGMTKADAGKFLDAFVDSVKDAMKAGDKIQLVGFGNFEVKAREAKEGINPKTQEKITIPACKVPAFKASKALKDELN